MCRKDGGACCASRIAHTSPATLRRFTLIELVMALGVIGLLTTDGQPRLAEFLAAPQVKTGALDFQAAFARSAAINRNAAVSIAALQEFPTNH
jgi:Tfp pilus assembly protein FimT